MICPQCRIELPEASIFCLDCGTKIDLTCPVCGKIVPPGSNYCLKCGHDLSQAVNSKDFPKIDYHQTQSYTPRHLAEKILNTRSAIEGDLQEPQSKFKELSGISAGIPEQSRNPVPGDGPAMGSGATGAGADD